MLSLKIIKNNKIIYSGNIINVYVNAENLGVVEFQQGCANAIYKISGNVRYINTQNKETVINISDGVVNVSPIAIEIIC